MIIYFIDISNKIIEIRLLTLVKIPVTNKYAYYNNIEKSKEENSTGRISRIPNFYG